MFALILAVILQRSPVHLWEILVPREMDGREIEHEYHWRWDEQVRATSGGLTVLKTALGTWTDAGGTVFNERMIPVRIACTEPQIQKIIKFTLQHYKQKSVMAYRLSDYVVIKGK